MNSSNNSHHARISRIDDIDLMTKFNKKYLGSFSLLVATNQLQIQQNEIPA